MDIFISLFALFGIWVVLGFGSLLIGFLVAYCTGDDDSIMFGAWMTILIILCLLIMGLFEANGYLF